MKTQESLSHCHWQMLAVTVALCAATAVHAQSALANPIALPDETIMLSPFEVVTDVDKGYQATSTLSGARLATSLKDTPAMIGVLTKEFLSDIAGQNITDFGNWAVNTIVWGSDQNINTNFVDRDLVQARMRATNPAFTNYRNYFGTQAPMDYFNSERLEIPRGPNSLLYGDGPLGGLTTTNTKRGTFGTNFAVPALIFDSLGSKRATLDVNRTLGKKVAARVNLLSQRNEGWRDGEFYNRETGHGAISYRPWKNTLFRGEAEWGHTEKDGDWRTYTDQASLWDGRTNVNSANFLAAGTGTGRTTGAADYYLARSIQSDGWTGKLDSSRSDDRIFPQYSAEGI